MPAPIAVKIFLFVKTYKFYLEFLQTENGWIEDEITAYGRIADCYVQLGNINHAIEIALKSCMIGEATA
ncbi:hypothetical protein [Neobacillus ginsengisoli]|uniref:Tetratricopeptide repeat protein n=1 Tax=Neobacillus ginsengisoli TaxID=904295 RepID=A0ABT9XVU9_9BACI|nr:hypothetical protein [Neobacillus ginsengisoli]MDQ0199513.1 hypothetical protein [Neobacillus ginsengisoli]